MNINKCGPDTSWRLVHDGTDVLALFESNGFTETIHTLFEADTKEECEAEIGRLGLNPLQENEEVQP